MDIGAAVSDIYQAVRAHAKRGSQLLDNGDLAVAGGDPSDALDFTGVLVVAETRSEDCSAGTTPSSAETITSSGAAEIT
jgi:hypothetical protein